MTAADRWVVGAALALVASLYVWSWGGFFGSDTAGRSDAAGVVAEVAVAGHSVETIDLGRDGEVEVQGRMGQSHRPRGQLHRLPNGETIYNFVKRE